MKSTPLAWCSQKFAAATPFLTHPLTVFGLYVILAVASAIAKMVPNNYLIYKYSFWHLVNGEHMYTFHPDEYGDLHHYGPVFAVLMAPFALLPDWAGVVLWHLALAVFLYWAIRQTRFSWREQLFLYWFCAHELLTALFMSQINIAIAGMILLSYCYIRQGRERWSAFFIALATLIKLFGIVGLAFFFFSKNKKQFLLWLAVWLAVLFVLPMLIGGPEYVLSQYQEWYVAIADKNTSSLLSSHQNISLLGMIRKIGYAFSIGGHDAYMAMFREETPIDTANFWYCYSDRWLILAGLLLFALPYLRFYQWHNERFRRMFLASALMFLCLFSTSTESSGYIIGIIGVVLWYASVPWRRNRWDLALLIFVFVLTSLSPSDLFPAYLRYNWVWPFSLKALPVALCWFQLIVEMLIRDYNYRGIR